MSIWERVEMALKAFPLEALFVVGAIFGFLGLLSVAAKKHASRRAVEVLPLLWLHAIVAVFLLFSAGLSVNFGSAAQEAAVGKPAILGIVAGLTAVAKEPGFPLAAALLVASAVVLARMSRLMAKLLEE
ncbi:MAG TPA: hypothetical protein EYP65_06825 [Armatimonadetes bacterium]|nr:hypothetical protein [Armatimonadota bacterium]